MAGYSSKRSEKTTKSEVRKTNLCVFAWDKIHILHPNSTNIRIPRGTDHNFFLTNPPPFHHILHKFAKSYPRWKPRGDKAGWDYIHKGVSVRFGFDAIRISQIQSDCQKQSNGNAPWDVYIQPSLAPFDNSQWWVVIYMHHRGAFSVARFDNQGNARAFIAWNEWQTGSTFFLYL